MNGPPAPSKLKRLPIASALDCNSRQQTSHERFVHDRHRFRLFQVLFRELPTLQHRSAHRFEITRTSARVHRQRRILAALGRLPFHECVSTVEVQTERDVTRDRDRLRRPATTARVPSVAGKTAGRALRRSPASRDRTTSSEHFADRSPGSLFAIAATCERRVRRLSGPRARSRSAPPPARCASAF